MLKTEGATLQELIQKKRAARLLRAKHIQLEQPVRRVYEQLKQTPPDSHHLLEWKKELADYEYDLDAIKQERNKIEGLYRQYHHEIEEYGK